VICQFAVKCFQSAGGVRREVPVPARHASRLRLLDKIPDVLQQD
jgi:hypothetical protein